MPNGRKGRTFNVGFEHISSVKNREGREKRRIVFSGFPVENFQFKSEKDINDYLSGDLVTCLLCGKEYKTLGFHLNKIHRISARDYKIKYGLKVTKGICGIGYHEKMSEKCKIQREKTRFHEKGQEKFLDWAKSNKNSIKEKIKKPLYTKTDREFIRKARCKGNISENDALKIIKDDTKTNKELAEIYDVSPSMISRIRRGDSYSHLYIPIKRSKKYRHKVKITDYQIKEILSKSNKTTVELAKEYKCSSNYISMIRKHNGRKRINNNIIHF